MEKRIKALIEKIRIYEPEADLILVKRAYTVAKKAHLDQYRKSGEHYIFHPLGVANILAKLELDSTSIAVALLHDVVEDTAISLDDIQKDFGKEATELIDGLTKLSQIEFKSEEEKQAENLRKMMLAMSKDIRVIFIKLADRLDNMRTIQHLNPEKQKQKARETLDIYAPLAHRLGIFKIKWELEDLSFKTLEPKKYAEIAKMVSETRRKREVYLKKASEILSVELKKVKIKNEILGRIKHYYSIYEKMIRRGKEFNEIYDLSGLRILVDSIKDCYAVLGVIHSLWKPIPGAFKDYIAMPKFNMYRSLHTTVIGPMGRPLELQIRTHDMHSTAEYGVAAHWHYKEGTIMDKGEERLSWLRQMLEWESETKDSKDFLETLKIDLFETEVFVFTPKGDVISLPKGSTPLDFAYNIHTDVGHSCVGAKAGGKIVPLEYELQNGDIVEILTSKTSSGPSRDWLSVVKTSSARTKIRQWFSKESREGTEHVGREILQKELRRKGYSLSDISVDVIKSVLKDLKISDTESLYTNIGTGNISPKQVVTKIIHAVKAGEEEGKELELPLSYPKKQTRPTAVGVRIEGVEDALIRLARCCDPVPMDDIIGFITIGRGITVHRKDCSNVKNLKKKYPDRLIKVEWNLGGKETFQAEIQVEAIDRTKLLRDVSSTISDMGVNIRSATVLMGKDNTAIFRFIFDISSVAHLENILANVKKIDSVFDAYRV
ncbi:bifunctional (p)ppGpp synthetase/guanosine-3',5'-bis(diphosphate) 3'-pyrophosphohydrolase [Candidatus Oleimmundimicrobium sp.]|uniref:RelA/SpoT family protein n=1 Tax=Candidatus Oleimmundimicrobium sp. TaxID=3060597 RepID=UPI0027172A17|nr:bifunctional (p)ppGpp synthetase/guanosine-3',5'-bis(diphosphate) 3'-pyrophosphohydrolase [Candidatus Oleimmundimicrobium sp.]MDO8886732.1 bifunctional (p)ppGpp synthetase/guanosine-3',5'-bis(diphosphate) 3'-pyrophosphohydrolase [Candidatus Oleimmundimicrobium sp.]